MPGCPPARAPRGRKALRPRGLAVPVPSVRSPRRPPLSVSVASRAARTGEGGLRSVCGRVAGLMGQTVAQCFPSGRWGEVPEGPAGPGADLI